MELNTGQILATAEAEKTGTLKFLDISVYWIGLLIAVAGNFIISIVLLPFLVIMKESYLYVSLALLGLAFGALLHILLREIEHLQHKHHIIAEMFIPSIALLNVYIVTKLANRISATMQLQTAHEPGIVALVYVIAFFSPHVYFLLRKYHRLWRIIY